MNSEKAEFGLPRISAERTSEPSSVELFIDAIERIREIQGAEGFYNAAAWETNGTTYLLGRKVKYAGTEKEPDVGSLILLALAPDGNIVSSKEVWQPKVGGHSLEDVRAQLLTDGRIAFGLTSVAHEGDNFIPYPAVLITSNEELMGGVLPEPEVIKVIGKGDQTTPLSEEIGIPTGKNVTAISPNLFAFRPEGDSNNHRLQLFEYQNKGSKVTHRQYIDFPDTISWAEYRVGTTMPPIWLNKNEAFLPIHGIRIVDGKYVYSIGTARLFRDENEMLSVDNISEEPIISPDLFAGMFNDEVELHDFRRVVYCCGGIPICNDSGELEHLKMYVNVGDKRTVEVTILPDKIIKSWQRNQSAEVL